VSIDYYFVLFLYPEPFRALFAYRSAPAPSSSGKHLSRSAHWNIHLFLLDVTTFVYLVEGSFVNKKLREDKNSKQPVTKYCPIDRKSDQRAVKQGMVR
jgi:hypothetical protein